MKCLESEKLIGYAYRLTGEAVTLQVRAHLAECSRCRAIVEQHGRLDSVLNEWKVDHPSPGFDARVRQAVEAQRTGRAAWGFWGWPWARGLALASLGALMVAGLIWFTHTRVGPSHSTQAAAQHPETARSTPAQIAKLHPSDVPVPGVRKSVHGGPRAPSAGRALTEDKDAQAFEDYDLAANFDLLSELPKGERRVDN